MKRRKIVQEDMRRESRYDLNYRLSISYYGKFARGSVLDWSNCGLQIFSSILISNREHKIRFHVEKSISINTVPLLESREGCVRWVHSQKEEKWYLGIEFEYPTSENLESFITSEDSCYLFFLPHEEDTYLHAHHYH